MQEGVAGGVGGYGLLVIHGLKRIGAIGERILQCLADFRLRLQAGRLTLSLGNGFRFERGAVTVVSLRGMDEPLGEGHLARRELEAVLFGRHHVGAGFQVSADGIEITLRSG